MPRSKIESPKNGSSTQPADKWIISGIKGIAAELGVSNTTAFELIRDRKLAHSRIGNRVVVTRQQIQDFLSKNEVPAFDAPATARRIVGR